jgi:hypothetical protein
MIIGATLNSVSEPDADGPILDTMKPLNFNMLPQGNCKLSNKYY